MYPGCCGARRAVPERELKMEKIKARQLLSITLTLFAVFFGAGNMIFPPAMGQQAGENYIQALAGFILTDAGIALLGMIAVVLVGTEVSDLGELVSRRFAVFLSVCIYLLIGPFVCTSTNRKCFI